MINMNRREAIAALSGATLLCSSCDMTGDSDSMNAHDVHSYSQPEKVRVRHVALELTASFSRKVLAGTAVLTIERTAQDNASPLILDTRDLQIESVQTAVDDQHVVEAKWGLGKNDPILGSPLTYRIPPRHEDGEDQIRVIAASERLAMARGGTDGR